MITSFTGTTQLDLLKEAMKIKTFAEIRDMLLASMSSSESFNAEQKLAIRIAGLGMGSPGNWDKPLNEVLLKILSMGWEDVNADGVAALLPEQREAIFNGLMLICKQILQDEADRLSALATSDTSLPADWNEVPE